MTNQACLVRALLLIRGYRARQSCDEVCPVLQAIHDPTSRTTQNLCSSLSISCVAGRFPNKVICTGGSSIRLFSIRYINQNIAIIEERKASPSGDAGCNRMNRCLCCSCNIVHYTPQPDAGWPAGQMTSGGAFFKRSSSSFALQVF
jgi:hypothetical protein